MVRIVTTPEFDAHLDKARATGLTQTEVIKGGVSIMAALSDADRRAACGLAGADARAALLKKIAAALK